MKIDSTARDRAYPRTAHGGTTGDERMNKFTPGPWYFRLEAVRTVIFHKTVVGEKAIAVGAGSYPDHIANARLIAAAPDLLVACQTFAEWLRREEAGGTNEPWAGRRDTPEGEAAWREWYDENLRICDLAQEQARAAIAKATGEAP